MTRAQPDERSWVLTALERFEGPLIHYTARILDGDLDRARDVIQDVFLRLCGQSREELAPRLAEWLFRVARNAALDVRRKESRMESNETVAVAQTSAEPGPAATAEHNEDQSRVARALAELPDAQQEVLQLRFQHGLTYRELASVTGRSVSHVGVLIHKGIQALRATLGHELGECMTEGTTR